MLKEKIENNCLECVYCARHYTNINGIFQRTSCMHCINDNITLKARKSRIANRTKCEYWQSKEPQIERRRKNIEQYLDKTAEKLNEIAQILKEDSNRNK